MVSGQINNPVEQITQCVRTLKAYGAKSIGVSPDFHRRIFDYMQDREFNYGCPNGDRFCFYDEKAQYFIRGVRIHLEDNERDINAMMRL